MLHLLPTRICTNLTLGERRFYTCIAMPHDRLLAFFLTISLNLELSSSEATFSVSNTISYKSCFDLRVDDVVSTHIYLCTILKVSHLDSYVKPINVVIIYLHVSPKRSFPTWSWLHTFPLTMGGFYLNYYHEVDNQVKWAPRESTDQCT